MTDDSSAHVVVVISAHPKLDEPLVDWLLQREPSPGFSSFPIRGHSGDHEHLTIAEQVRGRQNRHRFDVIVESARLNDFLRQLASDFGGADLSYWAVPALAFGSLGDADD